MTMVDKDDEHLRLLRIFHYLMAGLTALYACLPIFYLFLGILFLFAAESPTCSRQAKECPAEFMGYLIIAASLLFIAIGWTLALATFFVGRFMEQRKHYIFCYAMSIIKCLFFPYGTILGVFSLLVLSRESVKGLFEANNTPK